MKLRSSKQGQMVFVLALVVILTFALVGTASAGISIEGSDPVIEEDQVVEDDLFIVGETVEMLGTVEGDLFAAGQHIIIRGVVEGNVFAAGQVIVMGGEVGGTAHISGYAGILEEGAEIGRNLYFGGYSLEMQPESLVERSVYAGGYQVLVDGEIGNDLTAGVGALEINGLVAGNVEGEVGQPAADQTAPPNFSQYWGPPLPAGVTIPTLTAGQNIAEDSVEGDVALRVTYYETNVETPQVSPAALLLNRLRNRVGELIGLLIVGSLLLYFGFEWTEKVVGKVREDVFPSLGWGALIFLLYLPALLVLLFLIVLVVLLLSMLTLGALTGPAISVGGLGFFGFLTAFNITAYLVAKAIIAFFVGNEIVKRVIPSAAEGKWGRFWSLLVGVIIYEVLRIVPVGGFLVALVVVVIGVGAVFMVLRDSYRASRAAAA